PVRVCAGGTGQLVSLPRSNYSRIFRFRAKIKTLLRGLEDPRMQTRGFESAGAHSARMLDAGVSHPVVAEIMGWSTSTAIRMIREVYGHISLATRLRAIEQVEAFMQAQNPPQGPHKSPHN